MPKINTVNQRFARLPGKAGAFGAGSEIQSPIDKYAQV